MAWIAATLILAASLFSPTMLNDGDTFSHLATGAWIVAHRAVPRADPFSFSMPGAPWVAHEWLAEAIMALAFRLGGWGGVVALGGGAAALASFRLARHLQRFLPTGAAVLLLALAAVCLAPSLLARPHILALPAFEAWVAGLFIARAESRAPSWWLLPVMCLWANLHGGFIVGLLLLAPLTLEAATAAPLRWRETTRRWGNFTVAAVAAAALTPQGPMGLLFPLQLTSMTELAGIGEWQPMDFGRLQPLELLALLGAYIALSRGVMLPKLRLVMLLALVHMALQHTRHQMLIAVIVPLLLAEPLGGAPAAARPWRFAVAGPLIVALLLVLRLALPLAPADGPTAPIAAVAHVPAALRTQNVLNDYAFGGYVIYAGLRPFIDGRADMYGDAFLRRYTLITRPDKPALEALIKDYAIGWTLLAAGNPAVALLDALPGWCRRYADAFAVSHAHACAPPPR